MTAYRRKAGAPSGWKLGPGSVLPTTVRWPHGRGDLMLDMALRSGSSTEVLPCARL